ncbi:hypothetical protein scyTo_0002775, partial [Scyliorhinus torazame]|nr:hypothetical protein [Scyliorhinus torazame]
MWFVVALFSVLPFTFFDFWYFMRGILVFLVASLDAPVKDILKEQTVRSIVLLQDIDFLGHMNNSRYLRECDFARISLYIRNGMFHVTRKLKANMVLGAATIRYRRSLRLFEQFKIRSRILCWDEKAFYIEQEFISCRDSFVCATMLCRQ